MDAERILDFTRRILRCANQGNSRYNFLRDISQLLLDFTSCDALEILHLDEDLGYRWEAKRNQELQPQFEVIHCKGELSLLEIIQEDSQLDRLCRDILDGEWDTASQCSTESGCFWTDNIKQLQTLIGEERSSTTDVDEELSGKYQSLAILPFTISEENNGLVILKSVIPSNFTEYEIKLYEDIAQTLGLAAVDRRAQAALNERVKELTCLYNIARIAKRQESTLQEKLQQIVELLPSSWQHPDVAVARVTLDGNAFTTSQFKEGCYRQFANIEVKGRRRGIVEVFYTDERPELEVAPFLKEEVNLMDEVARQICAIVENTEAETEKIKLQEQLRHADRLATIGQLAAGVAHELNEPLGSILGFTQLAKKNLPDYGDVEKFSVLSRDLDKIEKASLHARSIIREMLIFARQMPTHITVVNLNKIVEEVISFYKSRCISVGIELVHRMNDKLPDIDGDPAQMNQMLINLMVNAIQAMPRGGKLIIQTDCDERTISLSLIDTGIGMSEKVKKQIFNPFFTTKDVNQGTGLGLSVVHGIVSSHGGTIEAKSRVNRGSCFKIHLPISSVVQDKAQE